MKLKHLILFCLGTFIGYSQQKSSFSIDWEQKYEPTIDKTLWVGNNIGLQSNFVPTFVKQWKKIKSGDLNDVKFFNIVSQKIDINSSIGFDLGDLPIDFNPVLNIVRERNVEYYNILTHPIYRDTNGDVFKVQSFEVSYEVETTDITNKNNTIAKVNYIDEVTSSVLSSGRWYKFAIDTTGVYKIDASFLNSLGIETTSLDPNKIRIYGNGGAILPELLNQPRKEDLIENAIYIEGENDGVFNNEDYILFYGQGPVSWNLDSRSSISHKRNIYTSYGYYFINVDSGVNGKRVLNKSVVTSPKTIEISSFTDYKLHEKELFNYARIGRQWFGEEFTINDKQDFVFNFPNILKTEPVLINGNFSAKSSSGTTIFTTSYNGVDLFNSTVSRVTGVTAFNERKGSGSFIPTEESLTINVFWNNNNDFSAISYFDYLEVIADRDLITTGKQFSFLNFESITSGEILEYSLQNENELDFVWDISDHTTVQNIVDLDTNSSVFTFKEISDGKLNNYQVVKISDTYSPIKLSDELTNVDNQNLHGLKDVQYIIVTKKEFIEAANKIRDYHENNTIISENNLEKINVEVVDINQVYNEFGSGASDITAIRDFVKFLYDNASTEDTKLKYLCLFGDASFDYRGITYSLDTQIVPVYLSTRSNSLATSYNSDDYYALLDSSDDTAEDGELQTSGRLDIVTGRIPVKTVTEADEYVTKLLNYYSTKSRGDWKNKITLLGDDGQGGSDQSLIRFLENSSLKMESNNANLNVTKLYSDAFNEVVGSGGGTYPEIKARFLNAFDTGSLVINYFGHGSTSSLGEEGFLNISDIRAIRNLNNLPLFITVTCDFSRFDDPLFVSAGEELIESNLGGAVAMITTTREIGILEGVKMNNGLADYLYSFDGETRTAAEALKDVKNNIPFGDNKFFVYLLGDPAMNIALPKEGIEITKVEKIVTDPVSNQTNSEIITDLNALSKIKVTGEIKEGDVILSDFNGTLFVTLFDKEIDRNTLLNEGAGTVVDFKSLENKVFVGEASVLNGKFSFEFILSKDVSATPENAKFSFYAFSEAEERIGSDFNFKVGGIDSEAPQDNTSPEIQLFMDDESFLDGGNTSTTPKLLAKIKDDSGINTSLNSIGHNITVVVDGDFTNPISLNEFYTTEKDDFTQGIVTYELPELSIGNHSITFKAWDTHNNSSTQTLNFYSQEDKGFELSRVLNYPNPFINHTEFWFKNNRQGDPIEITVQIYTLSGKLVKTIHQEDSNFDDISRLTTWDGKDDFGNRLGKGVYIYKLTVKEILTGESDEKIEKLVIL